MIRLLLLLLVAARFPSSSDARRRRPKVRFYILAGDDNIEGYASVPHLHQLAVDEQQLQQQQSGSSSSLPNRYEHLWKNQTWTTRQDVFVSYDHFYKDDDLLHGPLSINGHFGASINCFGPEIQLGHVLGNVYEEPVVIIKTGWKGRKLTTDFAPPSGGTPGFQWFRMMNAIQDTAKQLDQILGHKMYRRSQIEIGGIVWWHGYSDLEAHKKQNVYADNLVNFIRDVRSELKRPNLPFVVVELGGRGMIPNQSSETSFREMQQVVVEDEAFDPQTIVYVPTATYVQQDVGDIPIVYPDGDADHPYRIYYGHAETMLQISQAIGMALLSMDPKKRNSKWLHKNSDSLPDIYESNAVVNLLLVLGAGVGVFALVLRFTGTGSRDSADDDSTGRSPYRLRGWKAIRERFRPRDYDIPKEIELDFTNSDF
jgi:hypothetical protein